MPVTTNHHYQCDRCGARESVDPRDPIAGGWCDQYLTFRRDGKLMWAYSESCEVRRVVLCPVCKAVLDAHLNGVLEKVDVRGFLTGGQQGAQVMSTDIATEGESDLFKRWRARGMSASEAHRRVLSWIARGDSDDSEFHDTMTREEMAECAREVLASFPVEG